MNREKTMRVLCVTAWDGGSGCMTVVRSIAEQLRPHGVAFEAFCFQGFLPDSPWLQVSSKLYNHHEETLTEVVGRGRFDVVLIVDTAYPRPFSATLWLRRAGFRGGIVCMSQNTIPELRAGDQADVFVACSPASQAVMQRAIKDPIRVIPNAIDLDYFRPRPATQAPADGRPVLGWVGRGNDFKQKDIHGFFHLAAALRGRGYRFAVVDGGQNIEEVRLRDWFGEDEVEYHSQLTRDEMAAFYNRLTASGGALISTSTFEGLPLCLLEAMACRCPVIAPRIPGTEILDERGLALMYDRSAGLEQVIDHVYGLADAAAREALVDHAAQVVRQDHASSNMAAAYHAAFHDAIDVARANHASGLTTRLSAAAWMVGLRGKRILHRLKSILGVSKPPNPAMPKGATMPKGVA